MNAVIEWDPYFFYDIIKKNGSLNKFGKNQYLIFLTIYEAHKSVNPKQYFKIAPEA